MAKKLFRRQIEIAGDVKEAGADGIQLKGILRDTGPDGRTKHHMSVEFGIGLKDLVIRSVRAEMFRIPFSSCPETLPELQRLVGMSIASGYTRRVKELVGADRGCAHMTTLILAMGPAAMQAYFAARVPDQGHVSGPQVLEYRDKLWNTCYVWSDRGPGHELLKLEMLETGTNDPLPVPGRKTRRRG